MHDSYKVHDVSIYKYLLVRQQIKFVLQYNSRSYLTVKIKIYRNSNKSGYLTTEFVLQKLDLTSNLYCTYHGLEFPGFFP